MNASPFIFGGDTGLSYDEIQRMRAIAQTLREPEKISTIGEGFRSAAQSLAGGYLGKKAREEEATARGAFDAQFAAALGGGYGDTSGSGYSTMGGGGFTPQPAPQPVSGPISAGPGGTSEGLTPQAQDEWNKTMTPEPGGSEDNPFWDTQSSAGRVSSPDELDEREILARTIQMEAGNQGPEGMFGVGAVMDNRRRSGRFGGNDFRSVALAPAQFSPWNSVTGYAGGEQGSMAWQNPASPEAYQVADAILSGQYEDPTGGATHFVNHDISNPGWASKMSSKGQIGAHTFYSDGGQGIAGATPDTVGGGVRVAQNGPFQDLDQQTMRLIELANSEWASPGQRAMIGAMIDRRQKRQEWEWQQTNQGRWETIGNGPNGSLLQRNSRTGEIKSVGGTQTTVNNNMPGTRVETEYDKERGKSLAAYMDTVQEEGRAARDAITSLDIMEATTQDPSFYSGAGADKVLMARRAAIALGLSPETAVESTEVFNAQAKQAALDVMGGSLGTGFSNADRDFVLDQVPNLQNTPAGNRMIIEVQRRLQGRKKEIAQMALEWEDTNKSLVGFEMFLSEWANQNPVFDEDFADMMSEATIGDDALEGVGKSRNVREMSDDELLKVLGAQ